MPPRLRFLHPLFLGTLILTLAWVAWDAVLRVRKADRITATQGVWTDSPVEDGDSPTGYALGRRHLVLPYEAADGCHWIMQTQQMFATGELRVRHVDCDNAPQGREVHWASPFRWWLGVVAWLHHKTTGTALPLSVERAALYANPILLGLALLALTPLVAQRFGAAAGAALAVSMAGVGPFYGFFLVAQPDHHGAAALCALASVLFLAAGGGGWVRSGPGGPSPIAAWLPDAKTARRWFIAAGIVGGIGLWISAASQILVLAGIGCAALLAGPGRRNGPAPACEPAPALWRTWGIAGAATSLAAYAIEYFPGSLGWRLEVNHPLYAVSWFGFAELIHAWWRFRGKGAWAATAADRRWLVLATCAACVTPLVLLATHRDTFWVADSFLLGLHQANIEEFRPLPAALWRNASPLTPLLCLPLAGLVLGLVWLKRERANPPAAALLAFAFVPAAVLLVFALKQYRWFSLSYAALLGGLAVPVLLAGFSSRKRRTGLWLALLLAGSAASAPLHSALRLRHDDPFSHLDVYQLALRDLAAWLRVRAGTGPCVVATSPTASTTLVHHGSLKALGTFYWENLEGLHASTDLFDARTADEAHRIIQAHGVTHLIMISWDDFTEEFSRPGDARKPKAGAQEETFCRRLLRTKALPPWLRLLPYKLPDKGALKGQAIFVFEVVAPRTVEQNLAGMVHYLMDIEEPAQAAKFLPALARFPNSLEVAIARGRVELAGRDDEAFARTVDRLRREDGARIAALPVEDCVHLAALLADFGDTDNARTVFDHAISRLDEATVRNLSPSALMELLYHAPRCGAAMPPADTLALALEMLPLRMREQLRTSVEGENGGPGH